MCPQNVLTTNNPGPGGTFQLQTLDRGPMLVSVEPHDPLLGQQTYFDPNSLIGGWLGSQGWQCAAQGGNAPNYYVDTVTANADGYFTAVNANADLASGWNFGRTWVNWPSRPQGTVRASFRALQGSASGNVFLQVMNAAQSIVLGQAQITTSGAWQTASVDVAVTAGTSYWVRVRGDGANALLGEVTLSGDNNPFSGSSFTRWDIMPEFYWNNSTFGGDGGLNGGWLDNLHFYTDPVASVLFETDADVLFVETYNTQTNQNSGWINVWVNGAPYTRIRGLNTNTLDLVSLQLPTGVKTVELFASGQTWNGATYQFVLGAWPRAIYFNSSNTLVPRKPPSALDRVVIYGNSKQAGYSANLPLGVDALDPTGNALATLLRLAGTSGSVVSKAVGSRSLAKDYAAGANSVQPLAREIVNCQPTHLIIEAHRNDWGGAGAAAPWASVAAWSAQFQALVDAIHTALPNCQQWWAYTTHESTEAANAAGQTLAQFWTELDTQFTARAGWTIPPIKLDWRTLWSSVQAGASTLYVADTLHPNAFGYGLLAKYTRTQMVR